MLLDTSRHFQPISFLQQTVDALSYAKYNVLHWHVVDTQSFPFESFTYPRFVFYLHDLKRSQQFSLYYDKVLRFLPVYVIVVVNFVHKDYGKVHIHR
jgi:hypothetical protein